MTNPFDAPDGEFSVLVNDEGQHSLWPSSVDVPAGWSVVHGPDTRDGARRWVDEHWTDMRPRSLVARQLGTRCPVAYPPREYERLDMDPMYAELRASKRLLRIKVAYGDDAWLVTRHDHAKMVMTDPRFSRSAAADHDEARLTPFPIRTSILGMDPPDHTRLRTLLSRVFTQQRIEAMRVRMDEIAERLIDALIDRPPPADLLEHFVLPFSGFAICELMGIPAGDRPQFRAWIDGFASTSAMPEAEVAARMDAMYEYIGRLIADRREHPGDDLISGLIRAQTDGERLTEKELLEFVTVLLIAGYDTVALELASAVVVLLTHPEHTAALARTPELMPMAVHELLRFIPLDSHVTFARYAVEDVQVGETLVRAGDALLVSFPSANRDADMWNNPDELDFSRPKRPHFGFGAGIHRCAGAPLAVVEMQVSLAALLRRLPQLRLGVPAEALPWRPGMLLRSLESLPVTW
ncbi:cytochrome P450 [Nannocystis sp. SCPEA4]|uniref:cytochrome P450 n=1 Tax=Nannocystis sp. SCPEA4 TaxID=2996787 RepID=UPI0023EF3698|nr:cytochrome P450 [Nannocystis sp. SCPEA4]